MSLARGAVQTFTIEWDTSSSSLGLHVLKAKADLIGDANPDDNLKTKEVAVDAGYQDAAEPRH